MKNFFVLCVVPMATCSVFAMQDNIHSSKGLSKLDTKSLVEISPQSLRVRDQEKSQSRDVIQVLQDTVQQLMARPLEPVQIPLLWTRYEDAMEYHAKQIDREQLEQLYQDKLEQLREQQMQRCRIEYRLAKRDMDADRMFCSAIKASRETYCFLNIDAFPIADIQTVAMNHNAILFGWVKNQKQIALEKSILLQKSKITNF